MKTKISFILIILFTGFISFTQVKKSDTPKLIREKMDSSTKLWFSYNNENWNDKFKPSLNDLGYDIVDMQIDTAKVYPIARNVISHKYFSILNKERWYVNTKITGYGQIVSVSFWFDDESGVDNHEFALFAERLKKEIKWKLIFNKEVNDLFYLQSSFPGPKL